MIIPAGIIRKKTIIKLFLKAGAVSPSTAKTPKEVGTFIGLGIAFSKLEKEGILKVYAGDKYYIDKSKL